MVYTHADFIMTSVSWTIPSKIYSRDLGSCRDHKKQGSVRKFVFVTPDWARRASRGGGNGLVQHCRLPVKVGKPGQNLNHRAIHRRLHSPGDRDPAQQIAPGNTAGR